MENAVHTSVHMYLKRHIAFRKVDESLVCSDKTWQFLQTCIIMYVQKQVQLLILISTNKCIAFLQCLNKCSTVIFCYLCIFISTAYNSLHWTNAQGEHIEHIYAQTNSRVILYDHMTIHIMKCAHINNLYIIETCLLAPRLGLLCRKLLHQRSTNDITCPILYCSIGTLELCWHTYFLTSHTN
jgi:hypothetical protein